ncbi:D-amino-acid transaminase [Macrococcus hajekii]|uniref:D-alanine aminotransferase n=1 Tax=Macrococcus hajekii TaxID=198482 RepID=A0A4V3BE42_9STAP|nr:D-amino-acid transaminase [Macrococcus hajekii]TDM02655.1 D-amino-acid transaminase [Macrococcus hajekii]GGB02802.1 D-alanine aminotransferase [Macrococcus hajekii]
MSVKYFNGEFVKDSISIDPNDRGYQFGDGIYEVIRVYDGKLFTGIEHFERLLRSAAEIQIKLEQTVDDYMAICERLVAENYIQNGNIYVQVTRGAAVRNHLFPESSEPVTFIYTYDSERPVQGMKEGVKVITTDDIRWLRCDIKSLNLLGNVLNKQKAKEAGGTEAIQLREGIVTEGTSSNAYIVKEGAIYTHPANNLILNGITRQVIKTCAAEMGIPFIEQSFDKDALFAADEIFISSTSIEVTPVNQVDDQPFAVGPVTQKLQQAFEQKISAL